MSISCNGEISFLVFLRHPNNQAASNFNILKLVYMLDSLVRVTRRVKFVLVINMWIFLEQCSKSSIRARILLNKAPCETLPSNLSQMPFPHEWGRSAILDCVLNFERPLVSACQILALRSSSEELRKVDSICGFTCVIISIEYLQIWPRPNSLKVLIFNFRSDLLMHWHFDSTVRWSQSGGPGSTAPGRMSWHATGPSSQVRKLTKGKQH